MDGSIWLVLVLILAAACFMLAVVRRRTPDAEKSRHCPNCETPMSLRRVSIFETLTFRGMWICPHCGTRMRKKGGMARIAS